MGCDMVAQLNAWMWLSLCGREAPEMRNIHAPNSSAK
jgi:hypothetical protein